MIMDFDGLINRSIEIFLIDWLSFLIKRLRDVGLVTLQILLVIKSASKQSSFASKILQRKREIWALLHQTQTERKRGREKSSSSSSINDEWMSEWVSEWVSWVNDCGVLLRNHHPSLGVFEKSLRAFEEALSFCLVFFQLKLDCLPSFTSQFSVAFLFELFSCSSFCRR